MFCFAASGGAATTTTLLGVAATVVAASISAYALLKGSQGTKNAQQLATFVDGLIKDRDQVRDERDEEREMRIAGDKRIKELEAELKKERQGRT